MSQPGTSLLSMVALPPSKAPREAVRPWTKDLSLYEEFKLHRNELRRRSLNRRRELEKTLPQPLLADMVSQPQCSAWTPSAQKRFTIYLFILYLMYLKVRERREKTRLRVARWRAKRKLQACLNQAQVSLPDTQRCPTEETLFCRKVSGNMGKSEELSVNAPSDNSHFCSFLGSGWRRRTLSNWFSHQQPASAAQSVLW